MSTFHQRKRERWEAYFSDVYGWKQRPCTACNGSGRYDHNGSPKCKGCDDEPGSGYELYRGPKAVAARELLRLCTQGATTT